MSISLVMCIWKFIVQGEAADNIGNAEARVIYSSMNTATNEILMNI